MKLRISSPLPLTMPMSQLGAVRWEPTAGPAWDPGGSSGSSVSQSDVWIMSTMAYFVSELGWELGANDKWRKPQFSQENTSSCGPKFPE